MEKSRRDKKQIERWRKLKNNVTSWNDEQRSRVALKQKAKSRGIDFPSICDECGKTFRTDKALSSHKNSIHKILNQNNSPPKDDVVPVQPTFPTIDKIAEMTLQELAQQILAKDYIILENQRNELQIQMQNISKQKKEWESNVQVRTAKLKIELEKIECESKIHIAESEKQILKQEKLFKKKNDKFNEEKKKMSEFVTQQKGRVKLDVGGHCFSTSVSTLTKYPNTFFGAMFGGHHEIVKEPDGSIFIDRSPKHFEVILNYFRDGEVNLTYDEIALNELLREAKFYAIKPLEEIVTKQLKAEK